MPRKKTEEEQPAEEQSTAKTTPKKRTTRLFQSASAEAEPETKPKKRTARKKAESSDEKPPARKTGSKKSDDASGSAEPEKRAAPKRESAKKTVKAEEPPAEEKPKFTLRKSKPKKAAKDEESPADPAEDKPKFTLRKSRPKKAEKDEESPAGPAEEKPKFSLRKSKPKKAAKAEESPADPAEDKPKFTLRKSKPKKAAKDEESPADPAEDKPKFSLRKSRSRKTDKRKPAERPTASTREQRTEPSFEVPEGTEDILKHLSWRPPQDAPQANEKPQRQPKLSMRKSESRTRAEKADTTDDEPIEERPKRATKKPTAAKKAKPEVEKPKREHIPIPEDAAQVIVHGDLPSLVYKKQIIPPISFCATIDDAKSETVLEEVRFASDNGIHLFTLKFDLIVKEGAATDTLADVEAQTAKIREVDKDALIIIRIALVEPSGWEKKYKRAKYKNIEGLFIKPSICDDVYWSDAEACLTEFAKAAREVKSVIGVHIDNGEWFVRADQASDTSESATAKYREWLRRRYRDDDVALRAAWFDGTVKIETAEVPQHSKRRSGEEFVRIGRKGRRWVDYNLFVSDTTAERIAKLSYAVKKASEGWLLVGVSYGYTFEWSHPANGHLSLGKILRCPDIDYIAGPPSYKSRQPGSSAPFPGPIDSFALNGKLYLSEDDFKTPISGPGTEPDSFNPVMTTPQALESAHWRSAGAALAHRSGTVWTDSWGNGWLSSQGIWERAAFVKRTMAQRYAAEHGETDVAVLIDERSLAYLVDEKAFEVLVQNVRESVLRSGLSASFYLLSDLAHRENFPEAKLYVFLNAWDMRPEVRSAIKTRLQKDDKVLFWLYCAGLFEAGRDSLERVREVTGIALKPQPFHSRTGTTLLDMRNSLCAPLPAEEIAKGGRLEPSYFAIPEESTVLGEYTHSGLPSFVIREYTADEESEHSWTSVFLGEPVVSPGLFRALGQIAGAHVWNFDDDVIHCRRPFLTVHCKGAGNRVVNLPKNWEAYDLIGSKWSNIEGTSFRFNAIDGATHVFLVGIRSDIEAMLNADIDSLLKIEKLDPRVENTVHWDSVQFDVEIMKLDEWMEETWSEELADDLLLKPSMIDEIDPDEEEEEPPEQKSRGRRRRGQGRRGGRTRGSSERSADKQYDKSGIGVLFRKSK